MNDKKPEKIKLLEKKPENIVDTISDSLKNWVKISSESTIQLLTQKAREPYDERHKTFIRRAFSLFSGPRSHAIDDSSLEAILSSRGWKYNSLNTLIIKKLCTQMGEETATTHLMNDKSDSWWEMNAKQIASLSGLLDGTTKPKSTLEIVKETEAKYY